MNFLTTIVDEDDCRNLACEGELVETIEYLTKALRHFNEESQTYIIIMTNLNELTGYWIEKQKATN